MRFGRVLTSCLIPRMAKNKYCSIWINESFRSSALDAGITKRTKQALAETTKPAMKHGRPSKEDREKDYNCNVSKQQGNSAEYLMSVIARDHAADQISQLIELLKKEAA